jgi:hypothetical protein
MPHLLIPMGAKLVIALSSSGHACVKKVLWLGTSVSRLFNELRVVPSIKRQRDGFLIAHETAA